MKQTLLATALIVSASAAFAMPSVVPVSTASVTPDSVVNVQPNNGTTATAVVATDDWIKVQDRRDRRRGDRGIGAILYSNPDFRGDRYVIDGDYMRNLGNTGFNDRAQSLSVERGYWIFCSDADFQGRCRTFGPGEYRRLPRALDNRISSGRRISERYPYQGRPNWDDR